MFLHIWQIEDIRFRIYTNSRNIKLPFYPKINRKINKNIQIFLDESIGKKKTIIQQCEKEWEKFIPKEIMLFYEKMNNKLYWKLNVKEHINRYYRKNDEIIGYFPHITDDFLIHYSYKNNNITLYGNYINLYRILIDFASVATENLPLHASGVQNDDTAIILLSESGGGKTSVMLNLLEKGYKFITDDSLFIIDDKIVTVSDLISVKKQFPNNKKIEKILKNYNQEKVNLHIGDIVNIKSTENVQNIKYYMIRKYRFRWAGLQYIKEPFSAISKHSFWCQHYFSSCNQEEWIQEKIYKSFDFWNKRLVKIEPMYLNFDYENSWRKSGENIC